MTLFMQTLQFPYTVIHSKYNYVRFFLNAYHNTKNVKVILVQNSHKSMFKIF